MTDLERKTKTPPLSPAREERLRSRREAIHAVDELDRQLKKIYEKMGLTDEWDWIEKTLHKRFHTHSSAKGHTVRRDQGEFAIDTHAYNDKEFYLVTICGQLESDMIKYTLETLEAIPRFFEEHADRALYGVMAATEIPEAAREEALNRGLFVGLIRNEKFKLQTPPGFIPRDFRPRSKKS